MRRLHALLLLPLLAFLSTPTTPASAQEGPGGPPGEDEEQEGPTPYEEVITEDAVSQDGVFRVHRVDEDLYFEIPDAALGREMLLIGRPVEDSNASGFFFGSPDLIVQWERVDDRIVLRQKRYEAVADSGRAIHRQVRGMRKGPILAAFDVETFAPGDSAPVVEVTDLFTAPPAELGGFDRAHSDRSWLERVVAFPRNIDVEATLTGQPSGNGGPGGSPGPFGGGGDGPETVTKLMHWSMVLLPDEPMSPRLHDKRVGYISSDYIDYGRPEHRAEEREFIHRFELVPSDMEAFRNGELVEPVEPIVYWIDPATPEWLQPWVETGVEAWNEAFREAGFENAIEGRMAPTEAEDPEFSIYDARHSVVYWRPSTVANATGGQIVDPRSGEILKGEVNMYHNVMDLLRNWYFTQVSPLDERARNLPLPDSLMGRLVEYVVTHEIGHSIGFPHNMKASAMYPADSIRSESFLRRMGGHVATLMDYSRFNYVAQPEDDIPPELLIPKIGPYDKFAVRWGYRPIPDADTPDEERPTLDEWASVQDTVPWLRFTVQDATADPENLTEAVGDDDPVQSSSLGLENLQRVMDSLIPVAERPGEDYELLETLYDNAVSQWGRYMGHVAALVGGQIARERYGTGPRFEPVSRERQEEAMAFLTDRAFETPEMLIDREILRRIEPEGSIPRIRSAQSGILETLLAESRLNRLVEYETLDAEGAYRLSDLMADLREGIWSELGDGDVRIDVYRRNLQRAHLEVIEERLTPPEEDESGGSPFGPQPDASFASDVRPVLRGELRTLDERVQAAESRAADEMTRLHLEDLHMEIQRLLEID
jgi:hypothetical protein